MLTLATKESYFLFGGEIYQQVDGVAISATLGPTLANIFPCHYEDIWLPNCSLEWKPGRYFCSFWVRKSIWVVPKFHEHLSF